MKRLTRAFFVGVIAALCAFTAPGAVQARSLSEAEMGVAGDRPFVVSATSTASIALKLWYVGSSTQATVTITSATVIFYAPDNVLDSSNGLSSGWTDIGAAAYDTMGEFCDAVNDKADYGCMLIGAKRDDNMNLLAEYTRAASINDLKAAGGFDVGFDTNPANGGGNGSGTGLPYIMSVGATPNTGNRLCLQKCVWNVNSGGATVEYCEVYGKTSNREYSVPKTKDGNFVAADYRSSIVWQADEIADDTDETIDFTPNSGGKGICFARDAQAVVRCGVGGTSLQAAGNHLACTFSEQ